MKMLDILRSREAELADKVDGLLARMDEIPAAALEESRSVTPDEKAEFDQARSAYDVTSAELDECRAEIEKLEAIEARRQTSVRKAPVVSTKAAPSAREVGALTNADARAAALTFVERSRNFVADEHRASLTNLIERTGSAGHAIARMALTTGSDAYVSAWGKYVTGREIELNDEERQALALGKNTMTASERAMTSGTGASGGFLVPVFIDPTMVITGTGSINPMRQIATVKQIGPAFGGWYGATAAQVTASWDTEAAEVSDDSPTISQPNIPVYMARAFVPVSFEAFEDIADLAADVTMLFSDARDNLEADAHFTGNGSAQPTGVVTAITAVTASRVSPATGGTLALADVFSVNDAIPARFRNGRLAWTSSNVVQSKIRQLAMAQNSANSVWTDSLAATPGQLLGIPRYEAASMSATLTTGNNVLLCGDFSRYVIVDRVGFSIEFIPNLFSTGNGRPTGQRGWFAHWRTGGNTIDSNAFRVLKL